MIGDIVGGALSLAGGLFGGKSAESAADASAAAQLEAARIAAEAQKFRPVGITTRFGESDFDFNKKGYLTGASYTASPEIKAIQDRLSALYGGALTQAEQQQAFQPQITEQAQGLFNLGQGYLSESPEAARQRIFNQLQEARLPTQMREEQRLGAGVFGRGRAGLNIGSMGQPELFALGQAREEQRMRDVLAAEQQAQQQIEFGRGLLGSGLGLQEAGYGLQTAAFGPFQTQFGLTQLLEEAAQQPLDIGAQLGGRSAAAGANVGQTLLQGGLGAAQTRLQGSLVGPTMIGNTLADILNNPQFTQGIQGLFNRPNSANIYGQGGTGTVPTLNASPSFFGAGYFAQDR